jgi:hypothetical protein
MSSTNGKAPVLEQIHLVPINPGADSAPLREAMPAYPSPDFDFHYGMDQYIADAGDWGRLLLRPTPSNAGGSGGQNFATDEDLDRMRSLARSLQDENPLVQGVTGKLVNYTVKTGYTLEPRPRTRFIEDVVAQELAQIALEVIEEFDELNGWAKRERLSVLHSVVDGEKLHRHFPQLDGSTIVRPIEPEQIRKPQGSPWFWDFGIRADPHDAETALAYAVHYSPFQHQDDWEEVPATDVTHLKRNSRELTKRGTSDLFSTSGLFTDTLKLLRAMQRGGELQAMIAWVEEYDGVTQDSARAAVNEQRDRNMPRIQHPLSGKEDNLTRYASGSILHVPKAKQFKPAPLAQNVNPHVMIEQACLRALGNRWDMPEYMVSGDASNANYSSTLVAGSPFVNAIECEQSGYAEFFVASHWIAIRNAAAVGRFSIAGHRYTVQEIRHLIKLHWTAPQVAIVDKLAQAQVDQIDLANGVVSIQTVRAKRGYDNDQERRNLADEPPTRVTGRVVNVDPEGNPTAPIKQGQGDSAGGFFPRVAR